MAERHVVFALRRKYAELKGQLAHHRCDDPELVAHELGLVGAVLHMFAPDEDLTAVRPVRPYKADRGRWGRLAVSILRAEGRPMSARAVARRIMGVRGLDPALVSTIECSLHATLAAWEGFGIERVSDEPKRWAAVRRHIPI